LRSQRRQANETTPPDKDASQPEAQENAMSQTAAISSMMVMFMSPAILVGALCLFETVFGTPQNRPALVHVNRNCQQAG
jgi:hypothetical protein